MVENGRRRVFYATIVWYFFLSGIDYALILPTINSYLQEVGGSSSFMGVMISAFSAAGLIAAPVFGKWTDKLRGFTYNFLFYFELTSFSTFSSKTLNISHWR